jgi:DNA repair protein RecO (recombination protein O)
MELFYLMQELPHQENERLYRTEAVIIRRANMGEADRLLTVFTPARGKLRVVAKGVRRTTSRLGGHVGLFTQSRLLIAAGRNLDLVTQSEIINPYPQLLSDINRINHATYVVDLLNHLTEEEDPNLEIYRLLVDTLSAINNDQDPDTTVRAYELHLLAHLGYRPQLTSCVRCNNSLQPVRNYFSPEMGGALCPTCGGQEKRSLILSAEALKILRYLQRSEFTSVQRIRLKTELRREMAIVMQGYTRYLLERDLKSAEMIHTLY